MTALFAFAAVLGGVLVLIFLIGGEFDADVDGDVDIDAGDPGSALSVLAGLFSVRNIAFFAAFFGIGGLLLRAAGAGAALAGILAGGVGLIAAFMNHRLMSYIKRTDSDSQISDDRIAGSVARVILPIEGERKGRVSVEVDGHRINLVALPFKANEDTSFEVDDRVVIVAVENGSALVTEVDF